MRASLRELIVDRRKGNRRFRADMQLDSHFRRSAIVRVIDRYHAIAAAPRFRNTNRVPRIQRMQPRGINRAKDIENLFQLSIFHDLKETIFVKDSIKDGLSSVEKAKN